MAHEAGVSPAVVKRFELSETVPHVSTLRKLATALKVIGVVVLAPSEEFECGVARLRTAPALEPSRAETADAPPALVDRNKAG